jgi:hypothetical protein
MLGLPWLPSPKKMKFKHPKDVGGNFCVSVYSQRLKI